MIWMLIIGWVIAAFSFLFGYAYRMCRDVPFYCHNMERALTDLFLARRDNMILRDELRKLKEDNPHGSEDPADWWKKMP